MGVFALQPIRAGRWVCQYVGTLLAEDISGPFGDPLGLVAENEDVARSARTPSDYVFELTAGLSIDAINSTHFSRFINHAERCNMEASVSVEERRVDFYTVAEIGVGEELTIDYGETFWRASSQSPAAGTDSRNFDAAGQPNSFVDWCVQGGAKDEPD
uniref:SET domain-containing protein n=1 Tax=Haptolina ericina TaxID=156174 RepID=A0A7S3AVW3_9EUKA